MAKFKPISSPYLLKSQNLLNKRRGMYRFAPSPTGDIHIGNLRAALINFVLSLKDKSGFFLRIEDTDEARNVSGATEQIEEILHAFGVQWSAFYRQSDNFGRHKEFAHKLVEEGKAFYCFCSPQELEAKKCACIERGEAYKYDGACEKIPPKEAQKRAQNGEEFVIRLKIPADFKFDFDDLIKGHIAFEAEAFGSFVLLRANGLPTYNFACAVDDALEGTTCVVRGEDHTSNTPRQLLIRAVLGFNEKISFAHLPIILGVDGKKMSKRDASSSVKSLLARGFLPEAVANYLLLLGNKTPCEVFTLSEAAEWFELKNISRSPAKFDEEKLAQINREHIRRASNERLAELGLTRAELARFYTQESSFVNEIGRKIELIFSPKNAELLQEWQSEADAICNAVAKMSEFPQEFSEFKETLTSQTALKGKPLFAPLRLLMTGTSKGPELKDLYPLVREELREIIKKEQK